MIFFLCFRACGHSVENKKWEGSSYWSASAKMGYSLFPFPKLGCEPGMDCCAYFDRNKTVVVDAALKVK